MAWNMTVLRKRLLKRSFNNTLFKKCSHNKPTIILGIESSCDDTACGIVDETGTVLGESINSQHLTHLK